MDKNNSSRTCKNTKGPEYMKWKHQQQDGANVALKDDLTAAFKKLKAENTCLRLEKQDLTDKVTDQEEKVKQYKKKYETVNSDYEAAKRLCKSQRDELAALKENKSELQKKHESELVSLTDRYKKNVAILKNNHNLKTQQLIDEKETLKDKNKKLEQDVQTKFKEFQETVKNTRKTANKEIKAKDNIIKELKDTIKKLKDEITQIHDQKENEIESKVRICTDYFEHKIKGLDTEILVLKQQFSSKDKTIKTLTNDNQFLAQTISAKDEDIKDYKMTRKRLHERLMERKTQCSLMETKLRNTTEITQRLKQEISKLQGAEDKLKSELRESKADCENLKEKVENQKYRLQQYEPMLTELKVKNRALDRRDRDYVAGLEACKSVLYEPKKLQEKVAALILFYLEENKKVEVHQDPQHFLEMVNTEREYYIRIIQTKERENKRLQIAHENKEKHELAKKQVIVHHLNEYTQKSKKKTGR